MNLTTIKKRSRLGFTLVELIVVIAILAILAGIAIPVYSNYIKKANQAADLTLLDAVNTAFAAACLENGVNAQKLDDASLVIDARHCITGVTGLDIPLTARLRVKSGYSFATLRAGTVHLEAETGDSIEDKINDSFANRYFKSNTNTALKYYKEADQFDFAEGEFYDPELVSKGATLLSHVGSNYTFQLSNGTEATYTISDDVISAFNKSTYSTMGIASLMGNVGGMTQHAGEVLNGNKISNSAGQIICNAFGIEEGDTAAFNALLGEPDENGNYDTYKLANALVLAVAETTANGDAFQGTSSAMANKLTQVFANGAAQTQIVNQAKGGSAEAMSNIAMAYAAVTSYAAKSPDTQITYTDENGESKTSTVSAFYQKMQSDFGTANGGTAAVTVLMNAASAISSGTNGEFNAYITGTQGIADIDAYRAALGAIADNQGTLTSINNVVGNGYNTTELADILNQMFSSASQP